MVKIKVSITVSRTQRRPVMVGEKKYNNIQLLPLMKFLVVAKKIAVHTISGLQKGVQSVSMDKKLTGDVDPVNKKFELLNDKAKFICKAWGKVTETLAPLPGVESVFMDKELTGDIDPVYVTSKVSKKAVFKLALHNNKTKQKAIRTVGGIAGIVSIALDMKDKILTMIGDIDPVHVASKLRKICYTEIVSVGPAKVPEKKKEEPKKGEPKRQEEKKKDPIDSVAELVRPYKAYNPHIEGNQMISETSGKQGSEATSQRIEHKILEIQEMHGQSYPSSPLGQNDMPTEISLETTIQNRMINLSRGRYDKSDRGVESVSMDKKLTGDIDPVNKRKAVFKVEVLDDKTKQKAMKAVSGLAGFDSISLNMKDKTLAVTGDIDPITVGIKLRKICHTESVSVGPAKEVEKKADLVKAYKAYNPHIERYQMISETSGKQGSKTTSQRIEPKILQIQEMHEQSYPSSSLGQNDMPAEISPEATIQNRMINLSGGRYDVRINRTLNTIVESIKSPDIGKIGVYGRAGVGKTTVMEALKDLPEIRSMFDGIIWVTIPKTWNPIEVQTLIARLLSFSEIDDGHKDTAIYPLEGLKFLLILDNVGEHINLKMAGIPKPIPENGSKIVLITRSQQVCDIMAVDVKIRLEDLLYWELFCQNVGEVVDSPNIRPMAKQLVEMCCHYSHAIILMAGALKDVSDVDVWKNALEWLSPQPASYGENVANLLIDVLKFSCKRLADDTTKKCLRYCAQHFVKEEIVIESLIHLWIADGLVDTHLEGNRILQNLINANLLESVEKGVFVKLRYIVRHVLVNSIIQPEEGKLFLMSGGLGLTEPPKEEEWENAKEIQLMDNELSELPENPRCPMLSALFLQRNYKLRIIPPSFFDYMPALQVLNLSSTHIRSLPESLFRLVSLKRLFLNDCCNFMMLSPKVGELKQLEVLDLEGTEIMDLPREMKNLTRLKCLEVSLYGHANDSRRVKQSNAMVHSGIISALSEVEELNIDVKPDDERWYACAEAIVNEVCSLMKLSALKFYFPRVELLSHFEWNSTSMVYPVLSNFRFIVGDHVRRIMTRLPRDVEFELERWDRCLKYVNGVGVPGEIKKVLRHATAFHLDRHTAVKKLTEFGIENMEHLKCCVVGECNELQVIIDAADFLEEDDSGEIVPKLYGDRRTGLESLEFLYIYFMKNLRSIWEGQLQKKSLILLKSLTLCTCPQLTTIFTRELLDNLCNLEELTVEDCPAIISIVSCETSTEYNTAYFLPKLRKISLHYLPELTSISNGLHIAPKLEWMSFYDCPNLKSLAIEEVSSKDLKKIKGELSWWEALERRSGWKDYVNGIFVPVNMCD